MALSSRAADEVGLVELMALSPESRAHMSVAGEAAFLLGLASVLAVPFSGLLAVSVVTALGAMVCGVVGMATTRGPDIAGGALTAVGLFAGLTTATVVGLRYAGLDTAFGDDLVPWFADVLQRLNVLLQPR